MMRTIHIAGGGIAGLALGIGLSRHGVPVMLMDSGSYPRHRVCGEFLTGVTRGLLAELGLLDCFEHARIHRTVGIHHGGKAVRSFNLPSPAMGISRFCLDDRMANRLKELGGTVIENRFVSNTTEPAWIFTTGRRPRRGGMIGLKGHWTGIRTDADLELHLGKHAYLGLSAVEKGYTNLCGIFSNVAQGTFQSPLDRLMATLEQHGLGYIAKRLEHARLRPGSLHSVSGLDYGTSPAGGMVSVGDRRLMIPPFTGNGMTMALEGARTVLPVLLEYARGTCDWNQCLHRAHALQSRRLRKRQWFASRLHPFILNPSLQSVLVLLARLDWLPFRTLYRFTH